MRLTRKCQVTVPKLIRDRLGVGPGSEVEFRVEDGEVKLLARDQGPPGETCGQRLVRHLQEAGRKYASTGLTTDEIMEMTRGPFDDVDTR